MPTSPPTRPLMTNVGEYGLSKRLASAAFVFVLRRAPVTPLSPVYEGPYRVVDRGPKVLTLELGGCQEKVSVDRLKPCLVEEVVAANPPQRGWPPGASIQSRPLAFILEGGSVVARECR